MCTLSSIHNPKPKIQNGEALSFAQLALALAALAFASAGCGRQTAPPPTPRPDNSSMPIVTPAAPKDDNATASARRDDTKRVFKLMKENPAAFIAEWRDEQFGKEVHAIAFRGKVDSVGIGRITGEAGVFNLDFDANWGLAIAVQSVGEGTPYLAAGKKAFFNIHSPSRTLGRSADEASGKTGNFELIVPDEGEEGRFGLWVPPRVVNGKLRSGWEDE